MIKTNIYIITTILVYFLIVCTFCHFFPCQNQSQALQSEKSCQTTNKKIKRHTGEHRASQNNLLTILKEDLIRHEGIRHKVYPDTKGIPTIGIGYNLHNSNAENDLREIGVNIHDVLRGKRLTDKEIYFLFEKRIKVAINDAIKFLGKENYDRQPDQVKIVVINMAYNLGYNRLNKFIKFRDALINNNYDRAAEEMIDSRWYHQVGNRSKELVHRIKHI